MEIAITNRLLLDRATVHHFEIGCAYLKKGRIVEFSLNLVGMFAKILQAFGNERKHLTNTSKFGVFNGVAILTYFTFDAPLLSYILDKIGPNTEMRTFNLLISSYSFFQMCYLILQQNIHF